MPQNEKAEHPNSVKMLLTKGQRKMTVTGISIGGGNIQISELNGFKISLSMGTPTFITVHEDVPGIIASVTNLFSQAGVNIGTMTVTRESKGEKAIMIIESDEARPDILEGLKKLDHIYNATYFQ